MLKVQPMRCLHDEPCEVTVTGFQPHQPITISCHTEDNRKSQYFSYGHFFTDFKGNMSTFHQASLSGSYVGRFPMGLVAMLTPAPMEYQYLRLFKKNVETPTQIEFRLYKEHLTPEQIFKKDVALLEKTFHYRFYMAEGVTRIPIRKGRVRATMFIPKGDGPFPGIIDVFGTAGGLLEYRAAQLASRGFVSLALAYFGYEDLPTLIDPLEVEYFQEAVDLLLEHPKVLKPNVGAIGVSKGGDLVLSLAVYIPQVTAVVSINGCCSNTSSSLIQNGEVLHPPLEWNGIRGKFVGDLGSFIGLCNDPNEFPETIIPVEKADAHFLYLVSLDDGNWRSHEFADLSVKRLKEAGRSNFEMEAYPGAGHLLEPPYSSLCYASYHKVIDFPVIWGGYGIPHCEAQIKAWNKTLSFFRAHLEPLKPKL